MAKHFKNDSVYSPIATNLIGTKVWTCDSGRVTVRAMFYQNTYGFLLLVEDKEGRLIECNYSDAFTREPIDEW